MEAAGKVAWMTMCEVLGIRDGVSRIFCRLVAVTSAWCRELSKRFHSVLLRCIVPVDPPDAFRKRRRGERIRRAQGQQA
jgi:hypothetical protein